MTDSSAGKVNRRALNRGHSRHGRGGGAGLGVGNYWLGARRNAARALGKKMIVIGIDGMDPRLCERMMAEGLLAEPRKAARPADSARWARALRRRARSPGPTSSTAPGPATTGSSTSSTGIRRSSALRFIRRPRRSPVKDTGTSATTGSSSISGRSTTSFPEPCSSVRGCRSGIISTERGCLRRSTTCRRTTQRVRRIMGITAV